MSSLLKNKARAGAISLEIIALLAGIIVLCMVLRTARAETAACTCSNGPIVSTNLAGGMECQHGAEQDADCYLSGAQGPLGMGPTTAPDKCSDLPGGPANAPDPSKLTPQQQKQIGIQMIAAGWPAASVFPPDGSGTLNLKLFDGKCTCFDCQYNTTGNQGQQNTPPGPCEVKVEIYGAYCQQNKTGSCATVNIPNGTVRVDYPGVLQPGSAGCSKGNAPAAANFNFCMLPPGIGGTTLTYADCIDNKNCTSAQVGTAVQGPLSQCK